MNESGRKSCFLPVLTSLFAGVFIGGIIGILFAPKPGKETREEIMSKSEELLEKSKKGVDTVADKTKEFVDKSKGKVEEIKGKGEEIWKKGKG